MVCAYVTLEWGWLGGKRGKTHGRDNSGNKATPSRKDSKEAHHKLHSRKNQGDNKSPVHPASSLLVCVHTTVIFVAKNFLNVGVVHLPDSQGIEVELKLARRAVCDGFFARLGILVALAVGEEADLVEVLEFFRGELAVQSGKELFCGVWCDAFGDLVGDGVRVGCNVSSIRLYRVC